MELRQLRYFIAVAEALSFSRAATRLRLAQPSLSAQIRNLEDELRLRLLERDRSRVMLTDAGSVFLKEARQVLARADKAVARAREAATGAVGELRVASVEPLTIKFLPQCLTRLHAAVPKARVQVVEMAPSEQLPQLQAGKVHVGFIPGIFAGLAAGRGLVRLGIIRSHLILMMPQDHPLARRKAIHLREVADTTFLHIVLFGSDAQRMWTHEQCRAAGFTPHFGIAATTADNLVSLVAAGAGVALIPKIAERPKSPGCVVMPLLDTELTFEIFAMYSDGLSSPLRDTFLNIVAEEVAKLGPELSPLAPAVPDTAAAREKPRRATRPRKESRV